MTEDQLKHGSDLQYKLKSLEKLTEAIDNNDMVLNSISVNIKCKGTYTVYDKISDRARRAIRAIIEHDLKCEHMVVSTKLKHL